MFHSKRFLSCIREEPVAGPITWAGLNSRTALSSLCDGTIIPLTSGRSHRYFCCYCETEHLTVTILNSNVCTLLLRNTAGDSDFSFVIETIAFSFELKFK